MRRIGLLFEYPSLLGGEWSLLTAIGRLGSEFEFLAIAPPAAPLAEALRAASIPLVPSPLFNESGRRRERTEVLERLATIVADNKIAQIHGNSLAMARLTGALARRTALPCTAHLRDIIKLSRQAIDDINGNARLFAVSEATRRFHVDQGLDPARTITLHNGVDLERFRLRPRDEALRRELGIPPTATVTLTVGQIGLRKGWDTLAEALPLAADHLPELHALCVGRRLGIKRETREYEQSVRERLFEKMPGRVHFLGYREDVPQLLAAADLLVHPARQEPFGRVLLEAAAAGRAIVATDVGGTREMLGETARLVPAGDAVAMAEAIVGLGRDPEGAAGLAEAARLRVASRFSAARAAEAFARELGSV